MPFTAIYDDIAEDNEDFTISLRYVGMQQSGTGAVTLKKDYDSVVITILNATLPPPSYDTEPEGIYSFWGIATFNIISKHCDDIY